MIYDGQNETGSWAKRNGQCSSEVQYDEDRRGAVGFGHTATSDLKHLD